MANILQRVLDVREGETKRLLIMSGYVFVVIASYNIIKPMTRALFVSNLGLGQLPFLYMFLAVAVSFFVFFYLNFSAKLKLNKLLNFSNAALGVSLLVFWWFLGRGIESAWFYYLLFIWASIYGVLTTTQYWLMANYVFNAREAKRLFPQLTSAAILGGITGGYFTSFLVDVVGGTPNLALFCLFFLGIAAVLANMAWKYHLPESAVEKRVRAKIHGHESLKVVSEVAHLIAKSRHLALLMGIIGLTYIVVQIADFQFIAYASESSSATDDLAGFLGFWLSNMSIIALVFQLAFSNIIINRLGVGATVLFLPLALLLSSAWVFFSYSLLPILSVKIGEGAFRHSIHKVGIELLYLPIPTEVKSKTKAFVDIFADRFARGLAGVLLLIFYVYLGYNVAQISMLSVVLCGIWFVLAIATYREYVNSFRKAIDRRQIDIDSLSVSIQDEATVKTLISSLTSSNPRQITYALQLLDSVKKVDLIPSLSPLIKHESAEVRALALQVLLSHGNRSLVSEVQTALHDTSEEVRIHAVRFLAKYSGEPQEVLIAKWLQSSERKVRDAALHYVVELPELAEALLDDDFITRLTVEGAKGRYELASILGVLRAPIYLHHLENLLEDPDEHVRLRALESAGKTGDPRFIPILAVHLKEPVTRKQARSALTDFGVMIISPLSELFENCATDFRIRVEIPRILGQLESQEAVDILLEHLKQEDETLRLSVIQALNRIRARRPDLHFDKRVDLALVEELKSYFKILSAFQVTKNGTDPTYEFTFLKRILKEKIDDHILRIFRLLGLRYPPRDIYNAYAATTGSNGANRANAVEFLDNILTKKHKQLLLPIVEDLPAEQILKYANGLLEIHFQDKKEALGYLAQNGDPWLQACAIYEIGQAGLFEEYKEAILSAGNGSNSLVQETANVVIGKFA